MARIVTAAHRPRRPPRKRKAVAIEAAIVTKAGTRRKPAPDAPAPANDDGPTKPVPAATKIVTTTSRKRAKLQRAEQAEPERDDDPEATARVRAFLDRIIRPRDP